MERRNRSSRAVRFVSFTRDDERWPPVAFHHPRSGNANHTAMPAFAVHDHAIGFAQRRLFLKPTKNAVHDAPLFLLTLGIQLIKPARYLSGTLHVFLVEKIDHVARDVHASGSVQARRDAEPNFG